MENRTLNFDNYLFRCSSLGHLLTEPQSKADKDAGNLSKTTESYLYDIHKEVLFKRKSDLKSKFLDKGIQVEEKSLTLYSKSENKPFFKNEKHFKNDFISGTPDNCKEIVRDIKSSWDYSTFPFYDKEIKNKTYIAQLNGYMALTGINDAELIYCLVDTPEKLINDELRRADWKFNIMDNDGNIRPENIKLVVEIVTNMIYTSKGLEDYCNSNPAVSLEWFEDFREVPDFLRIKIFKIKRDNELIKKIYDRVKKARIFLNNLSLQIANEIPINE